VRRRRLALAAPVTGLISTERQLADYLRARQIDPATILPSLATPAILPLRVPAYYLDLIDWRDPHDPLRRQVLPLPDESAIAPNELHDPIGDDAHSPVAGLVHRYPDRALLLLTAACRVHCRFCFRREYVGQPTRALSKRQREAAFAYLADHKEIWEVILSGGDVLTLPDRFLADVLVRLRAIEHLRIVRIHSRVPAVWPDRISIELGELLRRHAPVYLVVHVNLGREVTPQFTGALGRLIDQGIPVLAQSVLLRGVNDDADVLADLFRRLVEARIQPYYLHHPDLARGTGHFRVSIERGRALMRSLRGRISGLCLPTYVLDIPGGGGKVPLEAEYVHDEGDGRFVLESPLRGTASYRDVSPPLD
jgi:lysine 2,3-aminomutase